MEASHKKHQSHIKLGKDAEEEEEEALAEIVPFMECVSLVDGNHLANVADEKMARFRATASLYPHLHYAERRQ